MLKILASKYRNSRGFINYFILTYFDKVISFALPLSVLFIIKDRSLYTFVEVVFSYATIAMVISELGFSNYLFFGYKTAKDKEKFLQEAQVNFKFLLLLYCALAILFIFVSNSYGREIVVLFILVSAKTLFSLFLNFYSNIYRLKDNPSGIYLASISINILSFTLLMLAVYFSWPHKIIYFFLPSAILVITVCFKFVLWESHWSNLKAFIPFLKRSLAFSWPIILNVLAMTYINNYAKIYAYAHLSQQETVQVSYIMRIGLIIQMTHGAFSSFFSKSLFMDSARKLNIRIFKRYSLVLILSVTLALLIILATNYFFGGQIQIPFSFSTFLFLFYILLWCYIGYLEIYFGITNANRMILLFSLLSLGLYILLLQISNEIDLFRLSLYMVLSAIMNLGLVIAGLYKLQVIYFKKNTIL
jgi:hypothetical protein